MEEGVLNGRQPVWKLADECSAEEVGIWVSSTMDEVMMEGQRDFFGGEICPAVDTRCGRLLAFWGTRWFRMGH
jgi:hypothetical protein